MSNWHNEPFGGVVSAFGTGFANGVYDGLELKRLHETIGEWQQYAWKLEQKLEKANEDIIKWRAVAIHTTAQARALGQFVINTTGSRASEILGQEKLEESVNSEKIQAEMDAQKTFENTKMIEK